jgi:mono/diheme cytochrome c family protein
MPRGLLLSVWIVPVLLVIGLMSRPTSQVIGATSMITTNLSGQQLFTLACASCHGLNGAGHVFRQNGQKIEVPAITYKVLAKTFTKNFDEQVRTAIVKGLDEEGKPLQPMMPRMTMLSPADVNKLIAYIKTLK